MGIDSNRSQVPPLEHLRVQALSLGVDASDDDLRAVLGFLEAIMPELAEIEASLTASAAPADLPRPDTP